MEYRAERSKMRKISVSEDDQIHNEQIFQNMIDRYAQAVSTEQQSTGQENVNFYDMQPGQSVFDQSGTEYTVVNSEAGNKKVLINKSQLGPQTPSDAKIVDDTSVGTDFTTTPPGEQAIKTSRIAMEDVNMDWDDIKSAVLDIISYTNKKNIKGLVEAADYLNTILLSHIDVDTEELEQISPKARKIHSAMERGGPATLLEIKSSDDKEAVIKKLRDSDKDPDKAESEQEYGLYTSDGSKLLGRHPSKEDAQKQEDAIHARGGKKSFHEPIYFDGGEKSESDGFRLGQPGYTDITNTIKDLVHNGYATVDIILYVGENFPRDVGSKVLEEARLNGIL